MHRYRQAASREATSEDFQQKDSRSLVRTPQVQDVSTYDPIKSTLSSSTNARFLSKPRSTPTRSYSYDQSPEQIEYSVHMPSAPSVRPSGELGLRSSVPYAPSYMWAGYSSSQEPQTYPLPPLMLRNSAQADNSHGKEEPPSVHQDDSYTSSTPTAFPSGLRAGPRYGPSPSLLPVQPRRSPSTLLAHPLPTDSALLNELSAGSPPLRDSSIAPASRGIRSQRKVDVSTNSQKDSHVPNDLFPIYTEPKQRDQSLSALSTTPSVQQPSIGETLEEHKHATMRRSHEFEGDRRSEIILNRREEKEHAETDAPTYQLDESSFYSSYEIDERAEPSSHSKVHPEFIQPRSKENFHAASMYYSILSLRTKRITRSYPSPGK
jgi:hypothetical protein